MAITPFPPSPDKDTDTPAQFAQKADLFTAQFPTFVTEANDLAADVTAKQITASNAATTATTKADEAAASAASSLMSPSTNATSTTSIAMAVGNISFVVEVGKNFVPGMWVVVANSVFVSEWMHGQVVSYDSGTGDMTVLVGTCNGSNTVATWTITLSAPATFNNPVFTGVPTAPTAEPGTNTDQIATTAFARQAGVPVGSVIFFSGGYFTTNSNGGFVSVLGNTAAEVNAYANPYGFYALNGAECNVPGSPIYDGPGRYLDKVTDDCFIMGDAIVGTVGGTNTDVHTHTFNHLHTTGNFTLGITHIPPHTHPSAADDTASNDQTAAVADAGQVHPAALGTVTGSTGGGQAHNHGTTGTSAASGYVNTGSPSVPDKRPKFIGMIPLKKVI